MNPAPTNSVLEQVLGDLDAESAALEAMVAPLDEAGWRTPTPAAGWDIATQIAHLAWTDEVAVAAATDKEQWDAFVIKAMSDPMGYVDVEALEGGKAAPDELLARWREARAGLDAALRNYPAGQKMPWFGPPMSPTSMATARFMETWAHSLDVAETLGVEPEPTDRIRHVAHLGVRTRNFSFATHSLEAARRGVPGRAALALRRGLGVGSGRRRAVGAGIGVRLLPAGDPAAAPRRPRPDRRRPGRRPLAGHRAGLRRPARTGSGGDLRWLRSERQRASRNHRAAVRVGNCSGFYGDRLSAMRELLEGAKKMGRAWTSSPATTWPS